jgi:hypothetical protein
MRHLCIENPETISFRDVSEISFRWLQYSPSKTQLSVFWKNKTTFESVRDSGDCAISRLMRGNWEMIDPGHWKYWDDFVGRCFGDIFPVTSTPIGIKSSVLLWFFSWPRISPRNSYSWFSLRNGSFSLTCFWETLIHNMRTEFTLNSSPLSSRRFPAVLLYGHITCRHFGKETDTTKILDDCEKVELFTGGNRQL